MPENSQPTQLYNLNAPVTTLTVNARGVVNKVFKARRILRSLRSLKRKNSIDVSISFLETANYLNILTKSKDKVIVSHRGSYMNDDLINSRFPKLRLRLLMPMLYRRASCNVSVSKDLESEISKQFKVPKSKSTAIENYYDIDHLKSLANEKLPEEFNFLTEKNYVVNVGRIHPQKGQLELLKVFSMVKDKIGCPLVIIGSGDLLSELHNACKLLGLSYANANQDVSDIDVYFLGYVKNPLPLIKHAQLFLFPSFWEGFPNALIEAIACETLVLSSDCPTGPREILESESDQKKRGILLPLLKSDDSFLTWANAILLHFEDSESKRDAVQFAIEGLERFTKKNIIAKWNKLIDE